MTDPDHDAARVRKGSGAEALRTAIDRGETGDKVAFSDPAAAPLGTDDEAAGRPATAEATRIALAHERQPEIAAQSGGRFPDQKGEGRAGWVWLAVVGVLLAAAALGLWVLR